MRTLNNLTAAIDIGSRHNSVAFMHDNGDKLFELSKLPNNISGLNKLMLETQRLLKEYELEGCNFVMESSGPYWFGPYWWLKDKCSTLKTLSVTALNSQIVSGFKGKFSYKKQKTDPKDATTIANRFRFGHFDPVYVPEGELLALRYYTRYRVRVVQDLAASKCYFLSFLFLKFSEYGKYCDSRRGEDRLFADVFGAASSAVIAKYHTAEELANAPAHELASTLKATSHGKIVDALGRAAIARKMAKDSFPLPPPAVDPVDFILSETLNLIRFLEVQRDNVDKEIEPIISNINDPIKSFKGIGNVFAAGIIAENGDFSRFRGHPQVANYFGIIPSMNDSGDFKSSINHMTKTGNSYGRYYYLEGANSLRRFNPVFKDYFQKKLSETTPRKWKRALGLTARKFIRIYWTLKKNNEDFNPDKYKG